MDLRVTVVVLVLLLIVAVTFGVIWMIAPQAGGDALLFLGVSRR
jgi:hypothetical protein